VHNSYDRLSTPLAHDSGSLPPAQPDGQTLQTPMMSSLTRDEIRRIVLDLIG
jgi:hypothetical protein